MKNRIGIEVAKAQELSQELNSLLANYQVYYQNLRGFHWNIKGSQFFELHLKFEELYTDAQTSIDEIAERILTLGETPMHSFEDYIATSSIEAKRNITDAGGTVGSVLDGLSVLLEKERSILELATKAGDEGTNDLMTGYIAAQEKIIWMLSAFLN